MKRVKIVVRGDVQGVFYRHNVKIEAEKLGIKGWCRNEPDGSVYLIAEGADDKMEKFVKWCKEGSPLSTVTEADIIEEKELLGEGDFEIR